MDPKRVKMNLGADDVDRIIQAGTPDTASFLALTAGTSGQVDADHSRLVVISGANDSDIQIESESFTPAANAGFYFVGGSYYHVIVPAGWFIGSTAAVRVCAYGS